VPYLIAEESRGTGKPGDRITANTIHPRILHLVSLLATRDGIAPWSSCQGHTDYTRLIVGPFVAFKADTDRACHIHNLVERLYVEGQLTLLWQLTGSFHGDQVLWSLRPTSVSIDQQRQPRSWFARSFGSLVTTAWRAVFDHDIAVIERGIRACTSLA
jgi:hypothetical protein